jgi:rRNA maturation RNase YbeY
MIEFNYIGDFVLKEGEELKSWVEFTVNQEDKELGEVNYIFCDDDYLSEINRNILKHNTLTDIISLDYSVGNLISGDIYISVERVKANADELELSFRDELHRVMIHGILHYCGYLDKGTDDIRTMRSKEDYYLSLRTF